MQILSLVKAKRSISLRYDFFLAKELFTATATLKQSLHVTGKNNALFNKYEHF